MTAARIVVDPQVLADRISDEILRRRPDDSVLNVVHRILEDLPQSGPVAWVLNYADPAEPSADRPGTFTFSPPTDGRPWRPVYRDPA